MKKLLLAIVAVAVVAPTLLATVVATVFAVLAIPLLLEMRWGAWLAVAVPMAWMGVDSLQKLCSHFFRHESRPPAPRRAAVGLACGAASALILLVASRGPFHYPAVLLFGPLGAAALLAYMLWKAPDAA